MLQLLISQCLWIDKQNHYSEKKKLLDSSAEDVIVYSAGKAKAS